MATRKKGGPRPPKVYAPSGLTQEQALEEITEILKVGEEKITSDETSIRYEMKFPFDTRIYTHVNQDGSVDGELRITNIPEEISIREALIVLTEDNPFKTFKGLWSSIGVRFAEVKWDEDLYKRYNRHRGLLQESTYYARTGKDVLNHQMSIMQLISERLEGSGLPRAEQIYIRFHWNKRNQKPGERYDRKVKK